MDQKTIDGTFPPQDEVLEKQASAFIKAKAAEQKAKDKVTTAYDALKETMREAGLDEYHCYTMRKVVILVPDDAKVKVKDVKVDEATPFTPAKEEEAAA